MEHVAPEASRLTCSQVNQRALHAWLVLSMKPKGVSERQADMAHRMQEVREAAARAELHLDVEVAALLPCPILAHQMRVRRQHRHGCDLSIKHAASSHIHRSLPS